MTIPAAPTNLAGQVQLPGNESGFTIRFTWDAVPGATSYNLYFYDDPEYLTPEYAYVYEGVASPYDFEEAAIDATWYYAVSAVNGDGESELSNVAEVTTPTLDAIQASIVAVDHGYTLSFDALAGADHYDIYEWTYPPDFDPGRCTKHTQSTNADYTQSGINYSGGPVYRYCKVIARDADDVDIGQSGIKEMLVFDPNEPAAPEPVAIGGNLCNIISWPSVPHAYGYKVLIGSTPGFVTPAYTALVNDTGWTHKPGDGYPGYPLASGSTWYFRVQSRWGGSGELFSEDSAEVSATCSDKTFFPDGQAEIFRIAIGSAVPGQTIDLGLFRVYPSAIPVPESSSYENTSAVDLAVSLGLSDEKWIEVSTDNATWTAIGGGINGTVYRLTSNTLYIRCVVPSDTLMGGDILASFELIHHGIPVTP